MGGIFGQVDKIAPSEIDQFRKYYGRSTSQSSQMPTKNHTTTDIWFLLFFTLFLTGLLYLMGYCILYGNIFRIINGYDNCGNTCGTAPSSLTHDDKRMEECYKTIPNSFGRYHLVLRKDNTKNYDRLCTNNCSEYEGYKTYLNRCLPMNNRTLLDKFFTKTGLKDFFSEVSEDFLLCWEEFVYLCLIALGLSLLILILFRYLVGYVVWIILSGAVLACLLGTIFLWILWKITKDKQNYQSEIDSRKVWTYLVLAISATVLTVMVVLIIFVMRKRIQLVVQLFEESGKAIAAMPVLLFEPILTFMFLAIVIFLWSYFTLWIESSGYLTEKRANIYYYKKDGWMKAARWYNFFAMLWMTQFIIGCQHMVIAGSVSKWYYTREKSSFSSPVLHSAYILSRYHLGSVAIGSFLVALIQFLRAILTLVEKNLRNRQNDCLRCMWSCCQCCLYGFENFLKYLTRNAYVEVAIYSYSFCKAGKQAFRLLASNALRVAVINSVGDFVLFLGKILVVVATILIGVEMLKNKQGLQHIWVPLSLAGLFAYFIAHCFMTVYEMTIDTIFLCFCEDCEQNDGISKPYYMSRGLMEFVENSKQVIDAHNSRKRSQKAWQANEVPNITSSVEMNKH